MDENENRIQNSEPTKLSVLVPAYNEAGSIGAMLDQLLSVDLGDFEVVVVDDGSIDGTDKVIEAYCLKYPNVRSIRQPKNMGKTAAIQRAIEEASGDILIVQDADLEYDPNEIPDVIKPIQEGRADVVYGSRFMVKKAARVLYFYHYLANKGLTFLSNLLTNRNMSDVETCYKAFRSCVIKPMRLTSRGFGMEIEITAKICKTQVRSYEVPISYYGRTYDEGKKIGLSDGFAALWYIFFYNLVFPWTRESKEYVRQVNLSLESKNLK